MPFYITLGNFLQSKLGSLASSISENREYWIFGINSYRFVRKCQLCQRGFLCGVDHHLQTILSDAQYNKHFRLRQVTAKDLNLDRNFDLVVNVSEVPPLIPGASQKRLVAPAQDYFKTPNSDEWCRILPVENLEMSPHFLQNQCKLYFPKGEITVGGNDDFEFTITEQTDIDSVINLLCRAKNEVKQSPLSVLHMLMNSREPKTIDRNNKNCQSLSQSSFALFCLFRKLNANRNENLDPLFKNPRFPIKRNMGPFRENLLPLGFVFLLSRLEVEKQIFQVVSEFLEFALTHLTEVIEQICQGACRGRI